MNTVAATLYFIASAVLLGLVLGFQNGALDARPAMFALGGGALTAGVLWWRGRGHCDPLPRPRGWGWVPVVLYAMFACRAFLWLIFRERDELRVLSPNNLGDMSLHLTFIEYFKNGAPLWPDSPIFAAGKTSYAVGMDFFGSLLALAGMDVIQGLVLTGLACALLAGIALWRWGGAFTLMAFLANGTLAGFACFAAAPDESFFRDYTGYMELDWSWKSLPLALLVTQRGFLYALPAGLALLCSWRTRFFRGGTGWRMPFAGELLLYAAMPVFHVHTFIALSLLLACFFIGRAAARRRLVALAGAAFIPATVLLYFTTGMLQSNALPMWEDMGAFDDPPPRPAAQILGWQPGWEVEESATQRAWDSLAPGADTLAPHGKFLVFWLGNFGLWPFLAGALLLAMLRQLLARDIPAWHAWLAALAFVLITPLLGLSRVWQTASFSRMLLGTETPGIAVLIALLALVAGALAGAALLFRAKANDRGLRWVLLIFAGLVFADSLLAIGRRWADLPDLRVNAIPLLLATGALLWLLRRTARLRDEAPWRAAFILPGLWLFFLCCNVKFAPWAWDNTKLMLWAYLLVVPFAWEVLIARWRPAARAGACFVLFFPGTVILLGGIGPAHHGHPIGRFSELDAVAEAVRDIPITATFAAEPTYNHPLLLNGRKLVLGYTAHLGSHGIVYDAQLRLLDALMKGDDDWRIAAAKLGARYLYYGPGERARWPHSRESWRAGAARIASGEWGELFDLETPPVPLDGL